MHIPATLVRGGTSKCWLFAQENVPDDLAELERVLVDAYGSADPVQLDGVGGATPTTSKAAVVSASQAPGVHVDYLFGQVGIGVPRVEWGSNCGNCATAIALWAVARGLVPPDGDRTRVVMRNTNTGAVLESDVDTTGGVAHEFGDQTVPGTRAGGVAVGLTFVDPGGRTTGATLPTGRALDVLRVGDADFPATLVDAGAPAVLVPAGALGATGTESLQRMHDLVDPLRRVRRAAARLILPGHETDDAVPKVGIVGPPADYVSTTGERIDARSHDVAVRMLSMNSPHPAIGLTSAVAVAVAGSFEGSTVRDAAGAPGAASTRIGTAAGVVTVTCDDLTGSGPRRVTIRRAARVLCEARIHIPDSALPQPA
ncbi:PrpF, AcnD-accessory [Saccharopolyspora sp. NFXS83]|uniref:PrpF domain-containing protein n=1 Tax=Saccharopolyspora sp. NFXS83 TaxID=2993560 RepID=UPI00224B2CB4|nr:PrpF domain-containing protein [Saccharopolyspora sp. NFXS83]MCX2729604.1 PrpF, AcnD-accessory [Saccharopolyspora sp. NFXS83]